MAYIYTLEDPITNEIKYVGVTIRSLKKRLYDHCSNYYLKNSNHKTATWIKSLRVNNLKPIIKLLAIVDDVDKYKKEIFYISLLKSLGFNLKNHTEGGSGGVFVKRKPTKHTEETKKRISNANKRPHSPEWIKNAADSHCKPIIKLDLNNNFIKVYKSATEAALELGDISKKKNISSVLRGVRKSAYGFKWKFEENIESKDKEL
jgi:hypothetical protein